MKVNSRILPVILSSIILGGGLPGAAVVSQAATQHVVIDSGDNALTKEQARQSQQQWDDTRNLRNRINQRADKEFSKIDKAYDTRDKCEQSANLNAYWEPKTLRCLDRRTGRPVTP